MKKYINVLVLLLLCVSILTGCSQLRETIIPQLESAVSAIVDEISPVPKEFTAIDISTDQTIYNADMYDEDTVILMLSNDVPGEYQVALYDLGVGISTSYTGKFDVELGDDEVFYFNTLSVQPYVVADATHEIVYKFSDDFLDVTHISTEELNTYSYRYSPSRDSLIYTINTVADCELREFSFETGEDVLLKNFDRFYYYADLRYYNDDENICIFSGSELFTNEYVNFIVDFTDMSIIGQCETNYTLLNADDGNIRTTFFGDDPNELFVTSVNIEHQIVSPVHSINMTDCVFSIENTDLMYVFESSEESGCVIKAYDPEAGMLSFASDFNYNALVDFSTIYEPDEEPMNIYIGSSENFCYNNGKLLFNVYTEDYIDTVVLWDTSLSTAKNEYLDMSGVIEYPFYLQEEKVYFDSNTEYAESIESEYGVEIYYGDSADIEFVDYEIEMVYDEDDIYNGLVDLEKTLSLFPDGFFAEFSERGYLRGINFYLCGEFTSNNEENVSDAVAFTYTDSGYAIVVANIYEDDQLINSYSHEICHVIDNILLEKGILDEEIWNSFNPDGFDYNYSYLDEDGNNFDETASEEYTAWGDDFLNTWNSDYIYFIDTYAKTYPTEDRARIFEYAMAPDSYTDDFFESEHLQNKLEYFSQCIREGWNSEAWEEAPKWEAFLES